MRFRPLVLLAALPLAALVTGCGIGTLAGPAANVASAPFAGKAVGGQNPVVGATILVYGAGTGGYGSKATLLAETQSQSDGSWAINTFTCPQSNTPLYVLSVGGDTGNGVNTQAVLGAGVGNCGSVAGFIQVNEISTIALAYAMSHYFSNVGTLGTVTCQVNCGGTFYATNDTFGGPSSASNSITSYSVGLTNANANTIPSMVDVSVGAPEPNTTNGYGITAVVEGSKIIALANSLSTCVNSMSSSSSPSTACTALMTAATAGAGTGTAPTDTLQAMINVALQPSYNPTNIFNLSPPQAPFSGALTTPPSDWSIALSYSTQSFGLNVDPGTVSTIAIDAGGRVWFPSNGTGTAGVGYFDPAAHVFGGPFNNSNQPVVRPTQVVIDGQYAYVSDASSYFLTGFNTSLPSATLSYPLDNASSAGGAAIQSVTVNDDGTIFAGVTTKAGAYGDAHLANNVFTTLYSGYTLPFATVAGDASGSDEGVHSNLSAGHMLATYLSAGNPTYNPYTSLTNIGGQVIFQGSGYASLLAYDGLLGGSGDGLCLGTTNTSGVSSAGCYGFEGNPSYGTFGAAIDGAGAIWATESASNGVLVAPLVSGTAQANPVYTDANNLIAFTSFNHPTIAGSNGYSSALPAPFGIAVDSSGNVWVSNATSTTAAATSNGFTLTELIGLGTPTITPVSAQIITNSTLTGTEPTK